MRPQVTQCYLRAAASLDYSRVGQGDGRRERAEIPRGEPVAAGEDGHVRVVRQAHDLLDLLDRSRANDDRGLELRERALVAPVLGERLCARKYVRAAEELDRALV